MAFITALRLIIDFKKDFSVAVESSVPVFLLMFIWKLHTNATVNSTVSSKVPFCS